MSWAYVALGGALGSLARYFMQSFIGHYAGDAFPYATLTVNVMGSLIMGVFIGWIARTNLAQPQDLRLLVAVGILGGYTTFSSFSLDAITLLEEGRLAAMAVYIVSSVAVSLAALYAGLRLVRMFG